MDNKFKQEVLKQLMEASESLTTDDIRSEVEDVIEKTKSEGFAKHKVLYMLKKAL